jgi:1-acyl-sn-glycerol-3-phosphate acyltransferase
LRFIAWVATRLIYRFKVRGDQNIPIQGAAILVCNHVSFVDAVLLMAASPRPIRFIMDSRIFATPVLGAMFRLAKAIPIAPQRENPAVYEAAFAQARQVLEEGDLLCIFPEGAITRDGNLGEFKGGVMKVLQSHPVPVLPMALHGLWGSYFSRVEKGGAMVKPFRRGLFSTVWLTVAPAVPAAQVTPLVLREQVAVMLQAGQPGVLQAA